MSIPALTTYQNAVGQVSGDQLNTMVQSANNVAALRTITGLTNMEIALQGFTVASDGGQGFFYWNPTSTAPDDNGVTTVVPNGVAAGAWSRLGATGTPTVVNSVTNLDGSLTISPTTGNVVASLGSYNANTVLSNNTALSAQPVGVALTASTLLGRGASGNITAIPFTTFAPSLSSFNTLKVLWASTAQIAIFSGQIILQNSSGISYNAMLPAGVNINTGTSGAGGLDTGSIAPSTWYFGYVIFNGTTISGLISTSATAPTLPSGYTFASSAITALRTDSGSNIISFIQYGRQWQYLVGGNLTDIPVMTTGANTAWTAVNVATVVPTALASLIKVAAFCPAASTSNVYIVPNNNYSTTPSASNLPFAGFIGSAGAGGYPYTEMILESASIYWASTNAGASIGCVGFELNI